MQDCSSCCDLDVWPYPSKECHCQSGLESSVLNRSTAHQRGGTGQSTTVVWRKPALEDPAAIPAAAVPMVALPGAWWAPASMLSAFTCRQPYG